MLPAVLAKEGKKPIVFHYWSHFALPFLAEQFHLSVSCVCVVCVVVDQAVSPRGYRNSTEHLMYYIQYNHSKH